MVYKLTNKMKISLEKGKRIDKEMENNIKSINTINNKIKKN